MRSRWIGLSLLAVFALEGASCGLLGNKQDLNALLNYNPQAVGCMNELGPHVQEYFKGTIDAETWGATWDCATSNLKLFKQFVHSSDTRGFTQADIQTFVSKLLITNQTITSSLINALFELKASLFGGTSEIITSGEIDAINTFLDTLKSQTTTLLPSLALRASAATPDNLLALSEALIGAGDGIAASFNTLGNPTFSFTSAQTLIEQLAILLKITMPPDLVAWVSAVKVVMISGAQDGIAAGDWPNVIRGIVAYGGPALAVFSLDSRYLTGPNAMGRFGMQLATKVKASLHQTLKLYGGALPLSSLDSVIDSLPSGWLTIDHAAVKDVLRPVANRLLKSSVHDAIDDKAVDLIFDRLQLWSDRQTALEGIFASVGADSTGMSIESFNQAAKAYRETIPASQRHSVSEVQALAAQTPPLFMANDWQMTFTANLNYSLNDLSIFNWVSIVAQQLIEGYSSVGGLEGKKEDMQVLVRDFTGIAHALHATDMSAPGWADARFLEGELFTFASKGNGYIDIDEATDLLAMAISAGTLTTRIRTVVEQRCPSLGQDILGHQLVSAACFRKELFTNYHIYWDHEPLLVDFYTNLNDSDKITLQQSMEKAARLCGVTEDPVGSNDESGFAGISQYVESLLARFDTNESQWIDLNESYNAYPVFKGPIIELKPSIKDYPDWVIKSIFTYILKNGHAPTEDIPGMLSLALWIAETPFWSVKADRLTLYEVIASIVTAPAGACGVPPPAPTPTPSTSATGTVPNLMEFLANPSAYTTEPVPAPIGM